MTNDWSLRDEILRATQRWPWLTFFCLAGTLLGWALSFVWPTPHRATVELYVGLNVYRSSEDANVFEYAGVKLVNANDYKNWQMASLNSLTLMDEVIQETLQRLRKTDAYWYEVEPVELARSLHVYWRNAGKWRLVAENQEPERAAQAVMVWQEIVLEHVHTAVSESQRAMVLEFQLKAITQSQAQNITETETLKKSLDALQAWQNNLEQKASDLALDNASRWQIWGSVAQNNPDGYLTPLLDAFPNQDAPSSDYIKWSKSAIPALKDTIHIKENLAKALSEKASEVKRQFSEASQKSRGLSASLDVERITGARIEQMIVRPTGTLVLIGSLVGLIAWLFHWFAEISLRSKA